MTDRIKGLIVTLERDLRDDDVEMVVNAIQAIRHVLSVETSVADVSDHMNRIRIRFELRDKLLKVFED